MTHQQKAAIVNAWLSGDAIVEVAQYYACSKITVETLLREAFAGLLKQLPPSTPPNGAPVESAAPMTPLPTVIYPCGCQASGTWPLPLTCPEHGDAA